MELEENSVVKRLQVEPLKHSNKFTFYQITPSIRQPY